MTVFPPVLPILGHAITGTVSCVHISFVTIMGLFCRSEIKTSWKVSPYPQAVCLQNGLQGTEMVPRGIRDILGLGSQPVPPTIQVWWGFLDAFVSFPSVGASNLPFCFSLLT